MFTGDFFRYSKGKTLDMLKVGRYTACVLFINLINYD